MFHVKCSSKGIKMLVRYLFYAFLWGVFMSFYGIRDNHLFELLVYLFFISTNFYCPSYKAKLCHSLLFILLKKNL